MTPPSRDDPPRDDASEASDDDRAARLAVVHRLHRSLAHDLRGPLNTMVMQLELLRSDLARPSDASPARRVELLAAELGRLRGGFEDLLSLLAPPGGEASEWDAAALAGAASRLLAPLARLEGVGVEARAARPLPTRGDRGGALAALLRCALETLSVLPGGSRLGIEAEGGSQASVVFRVVVEPDTGDARSLQAVARSLRGQGAAVEERDPSGLAVTLRWPPAPPSGS